MKKTRLIRRTPMPRATKPMKRTRLAPVNRKRKARRFEAAYHSPGFIAWVHSLACAVPGCARTDIHAAHVVSRARGGTWQDVAPLCGSHHDDQHRLGVGLFNQKYGIDLAGIAAAVALRWKAFIRPSPNQS